MTLQQFRYAVAISENNSITNAAEKLFVSQPSLTSAIKELEKELGVPIFTRTNRGIVATKEGETFLGFARQVLEQVQLIKERYTGAEVKREFNISSQHYSYVVNAFAELIKNIDPQTYDMSIRETDAAEIIEDVATGRSEIGILYLNNSNRPVLTKVFKENDIVFHELFTTKPYICLSSSHPLAHRKSVTFSDLDGYPYLMFELGVNNSFYFSEEIFSSEVHSKNIRVRDRATLFNLISSLNGYTTCGGIIDKKLDGENIVVVPLASEGDITIGYLSRKKALLSPIAERYIEILKENIHL